MKEIKTLPDSHIPVLPLRNTVVFPGQSVPLFVGRKRSVQAVKNALEHSKEILCLAQKGDLLSDEPSLQSLFEIGTVCRIDSFQPDDKGNYQIVVTGLQRVKALDIHVDSQEVFANFKLHSDLTDLDLTGQTALIDSLRSLSVEILKLLPYNTEKIERSLEALRDPAELTHLISQYIDLNLDDRQALLEEISLKARVSKILDLLADRREKIKLQQEIGLKVSQKMGKHQREAFLREQIRALQDELGEGTEKNEFEILRKKIDTGGMPEDVEKVAREQLKRLEAMPPQSPETHMIRNYLEMMTAMPWSKSSESTINLDEARRILDADHYGLEQVKKRIIQHLAVMKLKNSRGGSFLLLVGPPGVGKTSLGQSIAKALGRKYVRASLGGVRDDAEIRGHRRTYIGALPGRIIDGIKRAGENNPVFILDELDKLNRGYTGDPASALLEVLDPEQNQKFLDHYLDVPFDLSKVFFVATANSLEGIPGPLLDRMEVIDLSGYTIAEKTHIAKQHLIPKQWEENGLKLSDLDISDDALAHLISNYTREAGVRELQRKLAQVARALGEKVLNKNADETLRVEKNDLEEILGPEKFIYDVAEEKATAGVVTGLAWTPMGGDILLIESNEVAGTGQLLITGQLGDVMKESARIAMTLAKTLVARIKPSSLREKSDIHIHVPAGGIPKDGPSAGITMLTAVASLMLGIKVRPTLAMSGEVTLRGAVLPVGGIKEKLIAAHRAGIKEIILSRKNERNLKELPEDVKTGLKFHLVDRIEEVLSIALMTEVPNLHSGFGMTPAHSNSLMQTTQ